MGVSRMVTQTFGTKQLMKRGDDGTETITPTDQQTWGGMR